MDYFNVLLRNFHQKLYLGFRNVYIWFWFLNFPPRRTFCGRAEFCCGGDQPERQLLQSWVLMPAKFWWHHQIAWTILVISHYQTFFHTSTPASIEGREGRQPVLPHVFGLTAQPCLYSNNLGFILLLPMKEWRPKEHQTNMGAHVSLSTLPTNLFPGKILKSTRLPDPPACKTSYN